MRCGCLLVAAAMLLILLGIQKIHEAHAFSKPVEITAQQFMLSAPKEGWYKIKGCELEVDEGVYMFYGAPSASHESHKEESTETAEEDKTAPSGQVGGPDSAGAQGPDKPAASVKTESPNKEKHQADSKNKASQKRKVDAGDKADDKSQEKDQADNSEKSDAEDTTNEPPDDWEIRTLFIPVHCSATFDKKAERYPLTNLVVRTRDPALLATANTLRHLHKQKPEEMTKWLAQNRDKLLVHKDIIGIVQTGNQSSLTTPEQINRLQDSLAPDYLIVEEGKTPSMAGGLAALFLGILLGVVSLLYWVRYSERWNRILGFT